MGRPLLLVALAALVAVCPAFAQPPQSPAVRAQQEQNARLFAEFKAGLLRLAQKLQRSDRPEDLDRAKTILAALDVAAKENVDAQFSKLVGAMSRGTGNVSDVQGMIGQDQQLTKVLQEILSVLMTDDETARAKAEIARLEAFLKDAKELKRLQEMQRALSEARRADAERLAKQQQDLAERTRDLADRMGGKPSKNPEAKAPAVPPLPKSEPKEGSKEGDSTDRAKPETSEPRGESKDAGPTKPGDSPEKAAPPKPASPMAPGEPKDGPNAEPKPSPEQKGPADPANGEKPAGEPNDAKPAGKPESAAPKGDGQPKPPPPDAKPAGDADAAAKPQAKPADAKDAPKSKGAGDDKAQAKPSEGQPNGGAKSPPKDGAQQNAKGSPPKPQQGSPQESQPQQGQPQEGGQQNAQKPQPPPPPGRRRIEEAVPNQKDAADKLKKDDRDNAGKNQDKAIQKLADAIQELEKRLKQLREEEALKVLANLESRVNKLLAMQTDVYEATKAVDATIQKNGGSKGPSEIQRAQGQSDQEGKIVEEADKTLKLLEAEGSAVAFAAVLIEVRADMVAVQKRLGGADVGKDTQAIEENILAMLKDMAAAVKKAQQQMQQQQAQGGGGGGGGDAPQQLIDALGELRLIRALQLHVNSRTAAFGAKSPTEQAADPFLAGEIRQLSERQAKLEEMLRKIVAGDNR